MFSFQVSLVPLPEFGVREQTAPRRGRCCCRRLMTSSDCCSSSASTSTCNRSVVRGSDSFVHHVEYPGASTSEGPEDTRSTLIPAVTKITWMHFPESKTVPRRGSAGILDLYSSTAK